MATMGNPPARTGHVGVMLSGRYLLIWGGYQEDELFPERYLPSEEVWVFDVEIQKWFVTGTQGQVPPGTSGAVGLIHDHQLFIFGGHTEEGNTSEIYCLDLQTRQWRHLAVEERSEKPAPRDKHKGWVYDGKLYFYGGFGYPLHGYMNETRAHFFVDETSSGRGWNDQLFEFDIEEEKWNECRCQGSVPSARAAHAVAPMGDEVYLFGGRHQKTRLNDLYSYHMKQQIWKRLYPYGINPPGRSWHTLTPISKSRIFLYGGYTQTGVPLSDAWVLDTALLEWTEVRVRDDEPRIWHTTCLASTGDILIFGGCSNDILQQRAIHRNDILRIQCLPYSLYRLSLEAVFKYRDILQSEWHILPQSIREVLEDKLESLSNPRINQERGIYGRSCVIL